VAHRRDLSALVRVRAKADILFCGAYLADESSEAESRNFVPAEEFLHPVILSAQYRRPRPRHLPKTEVLTQPPSSVAPGMPVLRPCGTGRRRAAGRTTDTVIR
jgi:hypothetical protein